MRITRNTPSEPLLNGYLLDMSDALVLMHVFDDFEPDGYVIFRAEDVEKVRCGPYERWFDHMLKGEGLLGGLDFRRRLNLADMRSAIESVARHYDCMIVEGEDCEEDLEDFYIGSLVSADAETVTFRHFDALGYWERESAEIETEEITRVQFDTPYINIFSKYLRESESSEALDDD